MQGNGPQAKLEYRQAPQTAGRRTDLSDLIGTIFRLYLGS